MEAAEFPTERLPRVVVPQTVVGTLAQSIGGISEKANVFVALGDMQCSVLSCEVVENEAGKCFEQLLGCLPFAITTLQLLRDMD